MPHSNLHAPTLPALGLTVAFSVPEVCVIEEAAAVRTVGAVTGCVLKVFVCAVARAARVGRGDPEVVGGERAQAADRRGDGHRARARARQRGARRRGAVGFR